MNVTLPDGRVVENVPDGTSRADLATKLKSNGYDVPGEWMKASQPALAQPRAQTSPKPAQEGGDGSASRFTSGNLNKGIAGYAGLPVDAASNIINLGLAGLGFIGGATQLPAEAGDDAYTRAIKTAGKDVPLLPPAVGGSQWIENLMRKGIPKGIGMDAISGPMITKDAEPDSMGGKIMAQILQNLPGAMVGVRAPQQIPRAMSAAATSGVGSEVGKQMVPEGQESVGAQIGSMVPGMRRTGSAPSPVQRGAQEARIEAFGLAKDRGIPVHPREMKRDKPQEKLVESMNKELGLPPATQLEPRMLDRYAGAMYQQGYLPLITDPALAGGIKNDPAYGFRANLAGMTVGSQQLRNEFPNAMKDAGINKSLQDFRKASFSTNGTMEMIRDLRQAATRNLSNPNSTNPQIRSGLLQRDLALALEDLLEKNVQATGNPQLMENFRQARVKIAQAHDYMAATNSRTGELDPRIIGALGWDKPVTGELRDMSKIARAFPDATKTRKKLDDVFTERITPMAVMHPEAAATHLSARLIDPIKMSAPYQSFMVDPRNKLSQGNEQLIRLLMGTQAGQSPPFPQ